MSTVQERLQSNIDKFLATIVQKDDKLQLSKLPIEVFSDEQNVLVTVMNTFKGTKTSITTEFLTIYLSRNKKIITENDRVDKSILDEFSNYPVEQYINLTIRKFNELKKLNIEDENEENLVIQILEDYKYIELLKILDVSREIALEGYTVNRKKLDGVDDALEYITKEQAKLSRIGATSLVRTIVDAREDYEEAQIRPEIENELVTDFGDIRTLNEVYNGGIRTGYFYNILAPPKTGKTRFVIRLIHTAIVKFGTSVYAVLLEGGGNQKLMAELRATHFDYYYRKMGYEDLEPLSGQQIKDGLYPSSSIELMEQESFRDFLYNDTYGRLTYPDNEYDLSIDNLEDTITQAKENARAKMVVIDYLQLISFNSKRMKKNEAISEAYITCARLATRLNIAFISPSQMKMDFLNTASRSDDLNDLDTRTAAGESAEITRTPDANIALYATQQDMKENTVYLLPYLSRIAKPYDKTKLYIENETNYFSNINED